MNWSFVGRDDCFCLFLPANFGPLWTNLKVFLFKMIHAALTIIQASFHICISHCNVGQASSISSLCFSQTGIVHSIFLHLTIPSGVHETCGIYTSAEHRLEDPSLFKWLCSILWPSSLRYYKHSSVYKIQDVLYPSTATRIQGQDNKPWGLKLYMYFWLATWMCF